MKSNNFLEEIRDAYLLGGQKAVQSLIEKRLKAIELAEMEDKSPGSATSVE